ncbi:nitroreductase family deazaflavin-dependent oxidoreductase [Pseudonocardia xinjiangensis]|uniref:Nitroreductase family deazaflavin-dependent oxidoreductase n=1 Tax=Pseudonocardia xinjiangensis TaxID=75289 RepID=A0ABX1RJ02_9PSEU|nr:nitroreductase family deazaflavin-dependent oxidoreductase [Pseudonocardia xinjiangensis]NMH80371.1 nitroreductase family deazaflavin-dependent oxidoreductase [Pseudonocardia xinjiangensis]
MSEQLDWAEVNPPVIATFRANRGKVGGRFAASPILLLHTVGARTGQERVNPLTYLPDGDRFVVFASDRGAPRHPDWFHNVVASPSVQVEVGDETLPATATVAEEPERSELFARQAAALPRFGEYQEKTSRTIPVVILTPAPRDRTY